MLVLSRKKNESIVINNNITVVVVEIRGDKVRLGVEAPAEVPVHRGEIEAAIKRTEAETASLQALLETIPPETPEASNDGPADSPGEAAA